MSTTDQASLDSAAKAVGCEDAHDLQRIRDEELAKRIEEKGEQDE